MVRKVVKLKLNFLKGGGKLPFFYFASLHKLKSVCEDVINKVKAQADRSVLCGQND